MAKSNNGGAVVRGLKISSLILACCLGLAGCSAGSGSGAEGVSVEGTPALSAPNSSAESTVAPTAAPSAEPTSSVPAGLAQALEFNRPRDTNGKPIWPDGVVGRGYEIPPQAKDAPPLPQWVKDFNPEMPEAARQPTEAGAKAFAEYAFASAFYELNTGTTSIARSISRRKKTNFVKQLDVLDKGVLDGAWARMSKFKIVSSRLLESNDEKTGYIIEVSYNASLTYSKSDTKGISETEIYKGQASIFYDPEVKWQVYQLAFPKNRVK